MRLLAVSIFMTGIAVALMMAFALRYAPAPTSGGPAFAVVDQWTGCIVNPLRLCPKQVEDGR